MKKTLLEIVQKILSSLDGDEVNSIGDTVESTQVAEIVESVYEDIVSLVDLPVRKRLIELTASLNVGTPTVMYRPENVSSIEWVKYNKMESGSTIPKWEDVKYLCPSDFLNMMYSLDLSDNTRFSYTITVDQDEIEYFGINNKAPTYYTSFNDSTILFDSYDVAVDSTLQNNKSLAYASLETSFVMEDSFVPDLDTTQFSLLFNKAKALAFAEMKQQTHTIAERNARRAWIRLQRKKQNILANSAGFIHGPDYGRDSPVGFTRVKFGDTW